MKQPWINRKQKKFFESHVSESNADYLVSDNVYGAGVEGLKTALITHQLSLDTPVAGELINGRLASWINDFGEVWVPDTPEQPISGKLCANPKVQVPVKFIGGLTRFFAHHYDGPARYRYGALLGGPEPQRTVFENIVLSAFAELDGKKIIFSGSPKKDRVRLPEVEIVPMGDGEELAEAISACECIVARSGFSTLYDLLSLGIHGIVVPTPGQREQEYLAEEMKKRNWFATCRQIDLNANILKEVEEMQWATRPTVNREFGKIIDTFLD